MYYPYFRGKQNELIVVRDLAQLISDSGFVPIIEPVKEQTSGLVRAMDSLRNAGAEAILVVNPQYGDFQRRNDQIAELLRTRYADYQSLRAGILLRASMSVDDFVGLHRSIAHHNVALIHGGFIHANALSESIRDTLSIDTSVFIDSDVLYKRRFNFHPNRILLRDGFTKRTRNSDHPEVEFFSSLHLTYAEQNATGFGDFQIVGDEYSESGGPAYTVAIHLTYIDENDDDQMYVRHFKSDRQDSPSDPGGKFLEALSKLIKFLDNDDCPIYSTDAVAEFRRLHARSHFPGLGTVKKLSMMHHVETLAIYLGQN